MEQETSREQAFMDRLKPILSEAYQEGLKFIAVVGEPLPIDSPQFVIADCNYPLGMGASDTDLWAMITDILVTAERDGGVSAYTALERIGQMVEAITRGGVVFVGGSDEAIMHPETGEQTTLGNLRLETPSTPKAEGGEL